MMSVDLFDRCLTMVALLNEEYEWGLLEVEQRRYAAALARYVSADESETKLRAVVLNYYNDHAAVEALLQSQGPQLNDAWAEWMPWVRAVLQQKGFGWSGDQSVSSEDFAQIALSHLVDSIARFRYASRFTTWAHTVVVQSMYRHIRDRYAKKRTGQTESLDQLGELSQPVQAPEQLEQEIAGRVLSEKVVEILAAHPDKRLVELFTLAVVKDVAVEAIGQQVQLHPSRVRALLAQARAFLRDHPDLRDWRDDQQDEDPSDQTS